jgi:hypothetical protein
MSPRRRYRAEADVDPDELASFRTALRKRYSNEQILEELRASAARLGRSPTMKEFAADAGAGVHPQTVIEHFGTWNAAKRAAGLVPRRFVTRDELIAVLRELGEELGRTPGSRDIDARRGRMPSKSLYWHTFGSLSNALREAGFDVAMGEERLERAVEQGAALARRLGRLPKFADWAAARAAAPEAFLTEWQVYRLFDSRRGAWATFQFLVRRRLLEEGVAVAGDGSVGYVGAARAASRVMHVSRSPGARTAGSGSSSTNRRGVKRRRSATRPSRRATSVPSRSWRLRSRRPA